MDVFWEGFIDLEKPSRGIAKAHQQIITWAADLGLPDVLIAEDDIQFTAQGALEYFLANERPDYDLYLGGISYGRIKDDDSVEDFAGTHLYQIKVRKTLTGTWRGKENSSYAIQWSPYQEMAIVTISTNIEVATMI